MRIPFPPPREKNRERSLRSAPHHAEGSRELASNGGLNRLLRGLPDDELALLRPHLEAVELPHRHLFYERDGRIPALWFIEHGAASWIVEMRDGTKIEAGTVGNDGAEGIPLFLGSDVSPVRSVMQVPGYGFRLDRDRVRELLPQCPTLHGRLHRYTQFFVIQVAQSAACNRLHELDERCARWLLMAHDRVNRDASFFLTQDYLSVMLGVRRAGVSQAASELKKHGAIDYTRGRVIVLDRAELERRACECYGVVQQQLERLLPVPAE